MSSGLYQQPAWIEPTSGRAARCIKEDAWSTINVMVMTLDLPNTWTKMYAQASVTIFDKKRTNFIKITPSGELFHDFKVKGEFKSTKFTGSVTEACSRAVGILDTLF